MNILFLWGAWITPASAQDASSYGHDLESVLIVGAIEQLDSASTWQRHHAIGALHTLPVFRDPSGSGPWAAWRVSESQLPPQPAATHPPAPPASGGWASSLIAARPGVVGAQGLLQADEDWHPALGGRPVGVAGAGAQGGPIELTLSSCMPLDVTGFDRERRPLSFGELDPERIMRRLRLQPGSLGARLRGKRLCSTIRPRRSPSSGCFRAGPALRTHSFTPARTGGPARSPVSGYPELPREALPSANGSFSAVMDPPPVGTAGQELLMEDDDGSEGLDAQLIWSAPASPSSGGRLTQPSRRAGGRARADQRRRASHPRPAGPRSKRRARAGHRLSCSSMRNSRKRAGRV